LKPDESHALNTRAHIREASGETDGALDDFRRAAALDPSNRNSREGVERLTAKLALLQSAAPQATTTAASSNDHLLTPERRIALIIGNSAYRTVVPLTNPGRDAAALASTLRLVGFQTVHVLTDLSHDQFTEALRSFAQEASSADWAVVYFAGHGLEVGGTNYLIPVDAKLQTDRDVQYEAVPLELLLGSVDGARRLRLVILDACRDNPFVRRMTRTASSRSIGRGLAYIEPEGGTLVAYAAKSGAVAEDGEGANSPFVSALLKRLPTPGLEIGKLFRQVRDDVLTATGRKQEPFVYGSLPGEDIFFVTAK
jgi:uncharacterized caspase-like protein